MKLEYEGFSERGLRRGVNQDVIGMFRQGERSLFFVSDGMGGHARGERASRAVKEAICLWWEGYKREKTPNFDETVKQLKMVLSNANRKIREETEPGQICGTTIVLLFVLDSAYALLWCGDSRCYMAKKGFLRTQIKLLTIDDSWQNQPEVAERYREEELTNHPNYGKLTRAVGVRTEFACHLQTGQLERNTLFALCSDGIYKYISQEGLESLLKETLKQGTLNSCLEKLREAVYKNRASDNMSCVLVRGIE